MPEGPRLLTVGTINGSTPVNVDVRPLKTDVAVKVTLLTDYTMLQPPGYLFRPSFVGASTPQYPRTVVSGTVLYLIKAEADALVTAGGAAYV